MSVELTKDEFKLFENNGITKEQIQTTVDKYRKDGLQDYEIQQKINNKLNSFNTVKTTPKQPNGIDFTPSGIAKKTSIAISTPIRQLRYGEKKDEARTNAQSLINNAFKDNKIVQGLGFATDIAPYFTLPQVTVLKGTGLGAKALNLGLTGAYQGGLAGGLESLKQNGDLSGVGTGAGLGGAIGGALPVVGATLKAPFTQPGQNIITKSLEVLTSVPQKYSKRALEKELAGKSILAGNFDKEKSYKPIENKISNARNVLNDKITNINNTYQKLGQEVQNKFNKEIMPESWYDEQYKNLGQNITDKYLNNIKPDNYYANEYKKIADEALEALEKERQLRAEAVNIAKNELPETPQFKANDLKKEIDNIVNKYSLSGDPNLNYAQNATNKQLQEIKNLIGEKDLTAKQLFDINKNISENKVNWNSINDKTANEVLQQVSGRYSDILNKSNAPLERANKNYSDFMDAIKNVNGLNSTTFANKLSNYKAPEQIKSGLNTYIDDLDNLLPEENKFLPKLNEVINDYSNNEFLKSSLNKGALENLKGFDNLPLQKQDLLEKIAQKEIDGYKNLSLKQGIENNLFNNIKNTFNDISKYDKLDLNKQTEFEKFAPKQLEQYLKLAEEQNELRNILKNVPVSNVKNPRLLTNKTDDLTENAITSLEEKSGIDFMDELNDLRAREALEEWFPGQGGGSGSTQGIGNLLRTAIIGGAPTSAVLTHNPLALMGLGMISPKFMANGTIKNLGRYKKFADKIPSKPGKAQRILPPIAVEYTISDKDY